MSKTAASTLVLFLVVVTSASAQVCELVPLDTESSSGFLSKPVILDSSAYLPGDAAGIVRIDVSDPNSLSTIGEHPTQGTAAAIALDFIARRLLVADGAAGVSSYTLDGAGTPVPEASLDLGDNTISIAGSGVRWVAGSSTGMLFTLAVGAELTLQGSVDTGGQVLGISSTATVAYCALGSAGLGLVDTSDRSNPEIVTTVDLGGDVVSVERSGDLLYCGVEGVGVATVKIDGDQLIPLAATSLEMTPRDIVHWGGRLYMAGPDLLIEADASLGSDILVLSQLTLTGANGVALAGNVLLVSRGDDGLSSVDNSDCASSGILPTTRHIAAAARAGGTENTYWVTDVAVTNLTASVATFNMAYLVKNQANPAPANQSMLLEPGEQLMLNDVFSTVFELDAANGALRITGSHPDVRSSSRTYNAAGEAGTYGQFIPALPHETTLEPGLVGALLQLQESDGFRTNIGLLNITAITVEVEIGLYLGDGSLIGVRNETLLPFEMVQIDRIFAAFTGDDVDSGFAVIRVLSDGNVQAYASVVDNDSGDPIYVPAQILTSGTPFETLR